ncbi:MAG: HAD family hydrolase [Archangiaceae bacterium]|nr:HAD family hydrolase [Archangiaceae bacterium]
MTQPQHVILDVDDVMVDTDGAVAAAMAALDARVAGLLQRHYQTLISDLRGEKPVAYPPLRQRIEGWQRGLLEVKQWSRECLLAICFEDIGVKPTAALIEREARAYWGAITEKTVVYPDAAELIGVLKARGIDFQLATNSDGFLDFDEARQTFTYAPEVSARRKIERLGLLAELGITPAHITVGDPVGKPLEGFYRKVLADIAARTGKSVDVARTLAVGDSFTNDVEPFMRLGARGCG